MIYECPHCHTPQEAGQTVCRHCQARFDGPVPGDATVPQAEPMPAAAAETVPETPYLTEVKPPFALADSQPYQTSPSYSPPSYTPPSYSPPSYTPQDSPAPPPVRQPLSGLPKALLIVLPIVLALILGGVYIAGTLNTGTATTPAPSATAPAMSPHIPMPSASTPAGGPLYLPGGPNTTGTNSDPRARMLVGRWQSKSSDYYVFKDDGTGLRGNVTKQQKDQTFLWGLVQNRLMLYMSPNEILRFNTGPDDDTIFLGAQTGHYIQYSRTKT